MDILGCQLRCAEPLLPHPLLLPQQELSSSAQDSAQLYPPPTLSREKIGVRNSGFGFRVSGVGNRVSGLVYGGSNLTRMERGPRG